MNEPLEDFVPENLQPRGRYAPIRNTQVPFWWLKWAGLGLVLLVLAIWASGALVPQFGSDAWDAGKAKLSKQYPLGTTIYYPDHCSRTMTDPWSQGYSGSGYYCHYKTTEPGKQPYSLMLSMKRRGRWWIVDP